MNIQILNSNKTENGLYVNVMANKKEVAIYIPDNAHYTVNVLVKNASHSANRARAMHSTGKDFTTWEDAMNNYKSLEVQGAIMTAYELTQYNNPKVLN